MRSPGACALRRFVGRWSCVLLGNGVSRTVRNSVSSPLSMDCCLGTECFENCGFESVLGWPLKHVPERAFANCKKLMRVDLPLCVSIGWEAFKHCGSLCSINIPAVEKVEDSAFAWSGLRSFDFRKFGSSRHVKFIGSNHFASCERLESVVVFQPCRSGMFLCCASLRTATIVSDEAISVPYEFFEECKSLETVTLCKPVYDLSFRVVDFTAPTAPWTCKDSFHDCGKLTKVVSPCGRDMMCELVGCDIQAFSGCGFGSLDLLKLSHSGTQSFSRCDALRRVELRDTALSSFMFEDCPHLETAIIVGSNMIPRGTFLRCSGLRTVHVQNTGGKATIISSNAFEHCGVESIVVNGRVKFERHAVTHCSGLRSVVNTGPYDCKLGELSVSHCGSKQSHFELSGLFELETLSVFSTCPTRLYTYQYPTLVRRFRSITQALVRGSSDYKCVLQKLLGPHGLFRKTTFPLAHSRGLQRVQSKIYYMLYVCLLRVNIPVDLARCIFFFVTD